MNPTLDLDNNKLFIISSSSILNIALFSVDYRIGVSIASFYVGQTYGSTLGHHIFYHILWLQLWSCHVIFNVEKKLMFKIESLNVCFKSENNTGWL